jgi:protease IV
MTNVEPPQSELIMRRLIVRIFAIIGFLAVGLLVVTIIGLIVAEPSETRVSATDILMLDLTQPLPDAPPDDGVERLILGEQLTLRDAVDALARAGDDARVKGVVARVGAGTLGTAATQELRDAIAAFRGKGKFALAYAESFGELGSGTRAYYLAAAFDELWLQPFGDVGLTGLRIEMPFFRGLLDKVGVAARFDHRSEYKTAMNMFTETKMTPPHREETEGLLHSAYDQVIDGIATGRKLDAGAVRQLVDEGPFDDKAALDAHLVDHLGYREDVVAAARVRAGENATLVPLSDYLHGAGRPHQSGPVIAVIYADGLIVRGDSSSPVGGADITAADTVARAFRMAAEDSSVRAILFRIDSPGGSATASETIWHAVERAREAKKPIIVSMGDVAGSGGYYIAVPADQIVAEPATLTGSIGVVAGKFVIDDLSEKLGVSWDAAQLGQHADMFSSIEDFSPVEHAHFEHMLDTVYAGFKERVGAGRKLGAEAVEDVAKGRVWTGEQAKERGLVDALGGFETALALAKKAADIPADHDVTLMPFPPVNNSPAAVLARLLGRDGGSAGARAGLAPVLAALGPLLRDLELVLAPPGALTMPPLELR